MSAHGEFDPFAMCTILDEEGVEYVVLGGFAANHEHAAHVEPGD